jgi:hypothetical protein
MDRRDPVSFPFEDFPDHPTEFGIVIYHEDLGHFSPSQLLRTSSRDGTE